MPILFLLVILVVTVIGWVASYYVYRHRKHGQAIECVISSDCDWIISSSHSSWWGIPNDQIGLAYFSSLTLLTLLDIIIGGGFYLNILILLIALLAGVYALYLIYIQLHVLKHNCTWCIIPTLSAVIILIATIGLISV
ncbi:MAG: hypothetical protein A2571_00500 [Candidatus Vogelbacteria bacterium RIFOXYD1_FULL_44_32]|uniref:Vitamin K epoxide reductase domain-containing protein n=1 Tax=Candidatus Vogelbacteria bacterium RIFOXYD1_FULL_44_32 TaxID=1802438 RepID=A0A1G2QFV9_9BACT|nr:MAG: hypothetical protein A2571_00500 [Candidatus Vogelbacteria bacterium RIFOXYD1_FULL_44_32]